MRNASIFHEGEEVEGGRRTEAGAFRLSSTLGEGRKFYGKLNKRASSEERKEAARNNKTPSGCLRDGGDGAPMQKVSGWWRARAAIIMCPRNKSRLRRAGAGSVDKERTATWCPASRR